MKHKKFHLQNFNPESHFNKLYEFKGNETWELPEDVYTGEKWYIPELQNKKKILNSVKEQLNDFDLELWSLHTKKRDPSSSIIKAIRNKYKPELLTQAWCKFYECLSKHDLIPVNSLESGQLRTLHLCEAPGGFISALNHYLSLHHPTVTLDWHATTLNPEYEGNPLNRMIPDDRLIRFTKKKWLFGADQTGDITKYYNHEFIIRNYLQNGKASLITADGSVNCMDDPGDQERNVEHIHYCEVLTAFTLLEPGGTLVLKIFTTFEDSTICLLYLLNTSFQSVTVFKPITSKSGNSEMYVICKNFKGQQHTSNIWEQLLIPYHNHPSSSMFQLHELNEHFLQQLKECSDFFMEKQMHTINENVRNFINIIPYEGSRIKTIHTEITNQFLHRYFIESIMQMQKLVPECNITNCFKTFQFDDDSYYRYYYPGNGDLGLEIKIGKRLDRVFYSKYCTPEILDAILLQKKLLRSGSLFALTKKLFTKEYNIFDATDFHSETNWALQRQLFVRIHQGVNTNKDTLFINIPFLSNFLVGILYVLCSAFKCTYFFKHGIIYLKDPDQFKTCECKRLFDKIKNSFAALKDFDCGVFEPDLLEIIDGELNNHFLRAIWFFNNNLLGK